MTEQEIKNNYEELEAILVKRFPPEEYGEDEDLSSICTLAQELRDEAIKHRVALVKAKEHLEWIGYGDNYERECANNAKLPELIENAINSEIK